MFKIEIRSRSYGTGKMPWVDHLRNPIDKLVFSKEYHDAYIPGYYPVESCGSLYRNIDDFRQSPLQSLSDWQVRLPSVYSSKDGRFSTVNLLYYLEYINENEGKDFNLTGCDAILFNDDLLIFKGVVNFIEDATGNSMINIGESIGSPEIKKSDFPVVLGDAEILYWPVKTMKNEMNQSIIIVSERNLERFDGFFIYIESRNEFMPVNFEVGDQKIVFSEGNKTATFVNRDAIWKLENDISENDPFVIYSSYPITVIDTFRPDRSKETTNDYIVGEGANAEFIQAWSSRFASQSLGYELGRSILQHNHFAGEAIRKVSDFKSNEAAFSVRNYPVSLTESSSGSYANSPFVSGSPSFFLEASKNSKNIPLRWDMHPKVFHEQSANTFTFVMQDLNLPSSTQVDYLSVFIRVKIEDADIPIMRLSVGSITSFIYPQYTGEWERLSIPITGKLSATEAQKITLTFINGPLLGSEKVAQLTLGALQVQLSLKAPFDEAKLYAKGKIAGSDISNPDSTHSVVSAMYSLLDYANISNYRVDIINKDKLSASMYGSIIKNKAIKFRDGLRSLATESATLIKLNPASQSFGIKSISRQFEYAATLIPLNIIVLENNMYDFRMESAYRNDILNGILISWGKNFETGEYEHTLTIDFPGVYKDGKEWDMRDSILGDKWNSVKNQLEKNKAENIGVIKSIDSEWIMDWEGAEIMAYNYLCWNCAPLRKSQVNCIAPLFRVLNLDIGDFVYIDLPGYPPKFVKTAWVITGTHDNLDKMITTLELLEVWDMPVIPDDRYLLLEDGGNILLESGEKIKLENINV